MFGPKFISTSVVADTKKFQEVFAKAGFSALIDVEIEGADKEKVLLKEVQIHPLTDEILHVSMYVIDPLKELTAEVPIDFIGKSPIEDLGEGFVAFGANTVKVRCLPKNLPAKLEVDVSVLQSATDTVLLRDVQLPEGVALDFGEDEGAAVAYIAMAQKIEDVLAEIAAEAEAEGTATAAEETPEGEAAEGEDAAEDAEESKE
jgi:large subunit ribosomal protein L25